MDPSLISGYIEEWENNFSSYAEDLLRVQTIDGRIVPFEQNRPQLAIDEILQDIRSNGRLVRVLILKLRRVGVSTKFAGRNYWLTTTNPNTYALMVTHEPEATDTIFSMHKRFHANMPDKIRPQVLYDNRKVLEFNTKSRKGGLDSAIRVGTAGKENFGSSQLVNYAHFSEFAKWPTHCIEPLMTSLMPCIPKTPESELIIESTANGIGNMFHEMYWAARYKYYMYLDAHGQLAWKMVVDEKAPPNNIWSSIFIPWFVFEKNQITLRDFERQTGSPFQMTEDERKIVDRHLSGVPEVTQRQKMAWRRLSIINDFGGDVARFNQENPATDDEAFRSTGEAAFDIPTIISILDSAPEPSAKYQINPITGQFYFDKNGPLWVWEDPRPGLSYAIPADVAEGIVGPVQDSHDASVADVCEQLTGRQVAQWYGRIDPDLFGKIMVHLGRRYNEAWLIPESNNHGHTTISSIFGMKYQKIYWERATDGTDKLRKRPGFLSRPGRDGGVRAEAINALIASVREGRHGIRSTRTLREMLAFKKNAKGKYEAERGRHDDCVTTAAIGKYCIPRLPLPATEKIRRAQTLRESGDPTMNQSLEGHF